MSKQLPLPGVDEIVVDLPGLPTPSGIRDSEASSTKADPRGETEEVCEFFIETTLDRRRRRIATLASQGYTREQIIAQVVEEFGCSKTTIYNDLRALGADAREANDNEDFMDLVVMDALDKLRILTNTAYETAIRLATTEPEPGEREALINSQVKASREARQCIETMVGIFGRRSKRWANKQEATLTVVDGTPEQQEAVRRLLGPEHEIG